MLEPGAKYRCIKNVFNDEERVQQFTKYKFYQSINEFILIDDQNQRHGVCDIDEDGYPLETSENWDSSWFDKHFEKA